VRGGDDLAVARLIVPRTVKTTVDQIFEKHGQINQVHLVSGLQRSTDFTKAGELDFDAIHLEVNTNFVAYIHVIAAVLPHLEQAPTPVLAVVSSQLAIVPLPRTPVCARALG
jgi:short-subunit dehydrogenase involved in D-alanine esterification of teichoic acids